jgi:uncharacterized membrane protein YdjX (TVP38/TMEM64 family)
MYIEGAGIFAPLYYVATYAVATILFVPGAPLTLLGGVLFGPYFGALYTVIGATFGAVAAFAVGRFFGRKLLETTLQSKRLGKLRHYDEGLRERGFLTTLILRLIPLFPFNALNYALGLTAVKPSAYAAATLLGIIPGTFAYTYFGDSLAMLDVGSIAIAILLMIAVSVLGHVLLKRHGHKS